MSSGSHTKSSLALEEFLAEIARLLISAGVAYPEFSAAAQAAFVKVALSRSKLRNKRINQSAIAAITGLSRTAVRGILKVGASHGHRHTGPSLSVLIGWNSDPEFLTSSGVPRILPRKGSKASFQRLVKAYGRDVSERALFSELSRLKLIETRGSGIALKSVSSEERNVRDVRLLVSTLAQALQAPDSSRHPRTLSASGSSLRFTTPSAVGRILFRRRLRQGLGAFLADIKESAAVAHRSTSQTRRSGQRMSKVTVLVISQD